jgi:hypothetical protein
MAKHYVLTQKNFDYDDNYYTSQEGPGSPVASFESKEEAEKAYEKHTVEYVLELLSDNRLREFRDSWDAKAWESEKTYTFMGVNDHAGMLVFRQKEPQNFIKQFRLLVTAMKEEDALPEFYDLVEVEHHEAKPKSSRKKKAG